MREDGWGSLVRRWSPLLLALNLLLLWTARDHVYTGWEVVGAAEGARVLHTATLGEAAGVFWSKSRDFGFWNSDNSVIFPLVAGLAARVGWGSEALPIWNAVVTLALLLLVLRRLFQAPATLALAAVCASPVLVTHLIVGFPYISATWPPLVALFVLDVARHHESPRSLAVEALVWAAVTEFALHCYEPGRTFVFLPFLAAILLRSVWWPRRLLWVAVTAIAFLVSTYGVSSTIARRMNSASDVVGVKTVIDGVTDLLGGLFVTWYSDLPFLLLAALVGLCCWRRDRLFWAAALALQLALALGEKMIAGEPGVGLRPRRLILLDLYAVLIVTAAVMRTSWPAARAVVVGLVAIGQLLTLGSSIRFWWTPIDDRSLPWVHSEADFRVDRAIVADTERLTELIDGSGLTTILLYGYAHHVENSTDPMAVPERLYLDLGAERFETQVRLVDPVQCRFACIPSYDMSALLDALAEPQPFWVVVPRTTPSRIFPFFGARDFDAFRQRWLSGSEVVEIPAGLTRFKVFLVARPSPPPIPRIEARLTVDGPVPPTHPGLCRKLFPSRRLGLLDADALAASEPATGDGVVAPDGGPARLTGVKTPGLALEGWTKVDGPDDERVVLRLQAPGESVVELDGIGVAHRLVASDRGKPIDEPLALSPGWHFLRVYLAEIPEDGNVTFALERAKDGVPVAWHCPRT